MSADGCENASTMTEDEVPTFEDVQKLISHREVWATEEAMAWK